MLQPQVSLRWQAKLGRWLRCSHPMEHSRWSQWPRPPHLQVCRRHSRCRFQKEQTHRMSWDKRQTRIRPSLLCHQKSTKEERYCSFDKVSIKLGLMIVNSLILNSTHSLMSKRAGGGIATVTRGPLPGFYSLGTWESRPTSQKLKLS